MSEVQNVAIHSQSALSGLQQSVREGALLFVRILQNQGGGKYLASFAGGRFLVKSEAALKAGETFRAQVKIANGKLLLLPQNGGGKIFGAKPISVQNFNFQSPEAGAFLSNFGLGADDVSQKILQFLMQSGAKLDSALMKKARRLAAKFAGREIEAAESALVLEQKGFDSEDFLEEILDLLEQSESQGGEFQKDEKRDAHDENSSDKDSNQNHGEEISRTSGNTPLSKNEEFQDDADLKNSSVFLKQCAEEVKNFFGAALGGEFDASGKSNSAPSNSDSQDFQSEKSSGGAVQNSDLRNFDFDFNSKNFLAFFNHKAAKDFSNGKKNWIFLPFEFEMNSLRKNGGEALCGAGVFRILADLERNLVEKCSMDFKFAGKKLRFVLCFKDKKVCRVLFSFEGDFDGGANFSEKSAEDLARIFGEGVEVRALSHDEFSVFGTENTPLPSVEGFA